MNSQKLSVRQTGAVYTPVEVATSLVERCCLLLGVTDLKILEPSVGDGAFLTALNSIKVKSKKITAIDINHHVIGNLMQRYQNQPQHFEFLVGDFVQFATEVGANAKVEQKFNLIVGNPPFIRRHNFSSEIKESLKKFSIEFNYPLQRLKNTWPAFLIASARLVTDDGIVALVLPYELLTVDYGQKALNQVQQEFARVDIIVSKKKAFRDLDQDAVILIAQKKSSKKPGIFVTKVGDFENLSNRSARKIKFCSGAQSGIELNSYLLTAASVRSLKKIRTNTKSISHYASSAPGVVSAANAFFIRTKADITELGLCKYAKPILKKGSFVSKNPVFTSSEFSDLATREPCFLLHLEGEKNNLSPEARAYIEFGETEKLHERYKCRNRKHWYQVPLVKPEEAFFFKRSHSHPRVFVNEAGTYTTDTAYGVKLKKGFSARGFCFSFYTSLTMLFAEMNGRFYGGGVLELSPNEFRGLPMIYHEPSDSEFAEFRRVHEKSDGNIHAILDFGDDWLNSSGGLPLNDLINIRKSWETIRSHRMRHSGRSS